MTIQILNDSTPDAAAEKASLCAPDRLYPNYIYIARLRKGTSSGILAKVTTTVDAIRRHGRECRLDIISNGGVSSVFAFIRSVARAKEDVLIIRSDHFSMLLMAPVLLVKRLTGRLIILDVANPVRAAYRETWARKEPLPKRLFMLSVLVLSYPIAFWPAHRIQQYGTEGRLASLGVRQKIVLVGNAANIEAVHHRDYLPAYDGSSLVFGMAGHIAYFHGVDRFLQSMAHYKNVGGDCDIRLRVVGGGFEIDALKTLVADLELEGSVEFNDPVPLSALEGFFDTVHVGLCNLAQCRKGIFLNSDLKSRDMAARGLPFILAIEDPDFRGTQLGAIFNVPNDESLIDLEGIKDWYATMDETKTRQLRTFAIEKLSFDAKVEEILKFSEGNW
jgi:glycosyltransferase involved in cell wall biosynthesis